MKIMDLVARVTNAGTSAKRMAIVLCFCMVDVEETKTALRPLMHATSSVLLPSKNIEVSISINLHFEVAIFIKP